MFTLQDNDIFSLFDTGELEHVCDLIAGTENLTSKNYRTHLADSLNKLAITPMEDFINRLYKINATGSFESALKLKEKFEVIARLLKLNNDNEVFYDAAFLAESLKDVWIKFIAYNSAYRIYSDVPKNLKKAKVFGLKQTKKAQKDRKVKPTQNELIAIKDQWFFDHGHEKGWIKKASITYEISRNTVTKIMNNAH